MKKIFLINIFCLLSFFASCQIDTISPFEFFTVDILAFKHKPDTIYGVDISMYQGKVDFSKLDSSIKFVIMKVSEGVSRLDFRFDYNWENCDKVKGGYHFFRPQYSGSNQAKLYLSKISLDSGNIRPIIDCEYTPFWLAKKHRKLGVKNLIEMIDYLKKETGVQPIIYTGANFWNRFILPFDSTSQDVWIADWINPNPNTPKNTNWLIWQFTSKAKVSGIITRVDKNICLNLNKILIH